MIVARNFRLKYVSEEQVIREAQREESWIDIEVLSFPHDSGMSSGRKVFLVIARLRPWISEKRKLWNNFR